MAPLVFPVNVLIEGDPDEAGARRSRSRVIVQDMVPRRGSGSRVGPGYKGRLIEFVTATHHRWRPDVAAQRSDSLRRCLNALETLKGWEQYLDFDGVDVGPSTK